MRSGAGILSSSRVSRPRPLTGWISPPFHPPSPLLGRGIPDIPPRYQTLQVHSSDMRFRKSSEKAFFGARAQFLGMCHDYYQQVLSTIMSVCCDLMLISILVLI